MEDTKTAFEKLFNETISPVLEIYDSFKEYFGAENVDIQQINSFETFWKNNKGSAMRRFPINYEKVVVGNDLEVKLESFKSSAIENVPAELLQYYNIQVGLNSLYLPIILVHWDEVTITNENERSIVIQDLYAKTAITLDGKITGVPTFQRTTYTEEQWLSRYMHSHIVSVNTSFLTEWKDSCLGTGPIRDTIAKLTQFFDKNFWDLYCLELDKYVHVESLAGTPYKYLEDVGRSHCYSTNYSRPTGTTGWDWNTTPAFYTIYQNMPKPLWDEFFEHLITTSDFKFHFTDQYYLAMTYPKFAIYASNKFIDWYNYKFKDDSSKSFSALTASSILNQGLWKNNCLMTEGNNPSDTNFEEFENRYTQLVRFKKQTIGLKIIRSNAPENENTAVLLNRNIVSYLYYKIIEIVNNEQRANYREK